MLHYLLQMCSPLPPSSEHKNTVGISARLPALQQPRDIRAFCPSLAACFGCFFPPRPSLEVLGIGGITGDLEAGDKFQDEETGGLTDCVIEGSARLSVSSFG